MTGKIKFALWMTPEAQEKVRQTYVRDNCKSQSEFIEKAIHFYYGYLMAEQAMDFLPRVLGLILESLFNNFSDRMQSGNFITCKAPFGYKLQNGTLVIDEAEAEIIRYIFHQYLAGYNVDEIAAQVTKLGVPTRDGIPYWQRTTVCYILRNEKYVGDALLQKRYSTDTFPVRKTPNHGEREKYYVTDSHQPIIERELFETVQALYKSKSSKFIRTDKEKRPLAEKIFCGNCGACFVHKICRDKAYWVCRRHKNDKAECDMPQIPQSEIEEAFIRLHYKLKRHSEFILAPMLETLLTIRNSRMLWSPDVIELNKQISDLTSQNQTLAQLKQQGLVDSDFFISQTNELAQRLRSAKLEKERLVSAKEDEILPQTRELIEILEDSPEILDSFSEELFGELIEKITVESGTCLRFKLKNGLELKETIGKVMR